jgi:hypothetical protein
MKRIFLALLLAAPVLFSSCSKEETTIGGIVDTKEYGKRLSVSKSDLVKYEVIRSMSNNKYEHLVFKNNAAGVVITNLMGTTESWAFCQEWGVSNNTLTMVTEEGATMTFEVSKEYQKNGTGYTIIVYLKGSNGNEFAYECVDDGGNHAVAENLWTIISSERAIKQGKQ